MGNPAMLNNIINSNPELQNLIQNDPQTQAMLNNPAMM